MKQAKYAQSKGLMWIDDQNYFLYNSVGARAYVMSKGQIDNRKYLIPQYSLNGKEKGDE